MKKQLLFLSIFFVCTIGYSQDLSGFWKGSLMMPRGCFPINNLELQLTVKQGVVTGNSYQYLDINNYIKKKLEGTYDPVSRKLTLQETVLTTYKIPTTCDICIKKFVMQFNKNGALEALNGDWTGYVLGKGDICDPNILALSRTNESTFKEIPEIAVDTGEIRLDFYDNGVVDGDSITVLVNKQVVLSNQKLTIKPVTSYIRIDATKPFQEVEMVAQNLGSIPPNTALLIITSGRKRYQLFLTSSKEKSAVVRFVYEPDQNKTL